MKKIIIAVLALMFILCGCGEAMPFYDSELEGLTVKSRYKFCFADDSRVILDWSNGSDKDIYYVKEFKLEKKDGEIWYTVSPKNKIEFNSESKYVIDPADTSSSNCDLSEYTLTEGTAYRISTYCFDDEGNYYQVYAEFICNSDKANAEILAIMDGYTG